MTARRLPPMAILALLSGAMGALNATPRLERKDPLDDGERPDPARTDNANGSFSYCCETAYLLRGKHSTDCPDQPPPPVELSDAEKLVAAKKAKRQALELKRKKRSR